MSISFSFTDIDVHKINYNKVCLICLTEKSCLFPTASEIVVGEVGSLGTISDLIHNFAPKLVLETEIALHICMACTDELKTAYIFKLKFDESIKILEKHFENREVVKKEVYIAREIDDSSSVDIKLEEIQVNDIKEQFTSDDSLEDVGSADENSTYNKTVAVIKNDQLKNEEASAEEKEQQNETCDTSILHPCPICLKRFTALKLREHVHSHKALKKYLSMDVQCSPGEKFYASSREFKSIFAQPTIMHKCPFCSKTMPADQFRQHIRVHKDDNQEQSLKCNQCNRTFRKLRALNVHLSKHIEERPYTCEHCGKGFLIKHNYDCHILTHNDNLLPYECKGCGKRFSNPIHLYRHRLVHAENVSYGSKYLTFRCNKCLQSFSDKQQRKTHKCVPMSAENLKQLCLKTKLKTEGHRKGKKTYMGLCYVCGKYVPNIYGHIQAHGVTKQSCTICQKKLSTRNALKRHLLVHSGQKPFMCCTCGKAFNNSSNLEVHERIHIGIKKHICSVCNKGFLEKSYLKKHMRTHTCIK